MRYQLIKAQYRFNRTDRYNVGKIPIDYYTTTTAAEQLPYILFRTIRTGLLFKSGELKELKSSMTAALIFVASAMSITY